MKRKQNLTEELYRMRKLMNFSSSEFRENSTSYDRLIEESFVKTKINEQTTNNADPFAGDASCENNLVSNPAYAPYKEYVLKHQKDSDKVGKTLEYWGGGGGNTALFKSSKQKLELTITNINNLINGIKNRLGSDYKNGEGDDVIYAGKTYKISEMVGYLEEVKKIMTEFLSKNTVPKNSSDNPFYSGIIGPAITSLSNIKKFDPKYMPKPSSISSAFVDTVTKNIKNTKNLVSGGFTMDCDTKLQLLTKLSSNPKVKEKGVDAIKRARYIKVSPSNKSDIKVTEKGMVQTIVGTEVISYPPSGTENTDEGEKISTSMMPDNGYKIADEAKIEIKNLILEGIQLITSKPNGRVTRMYYGSAASTSTVNTTFTGVDKNGEIIPGESKKENNIALVEARTKSINAYLKAVIEESKNTLPNKDKVTVSEGETVKNPNQGPEWVVDKPSGDKGEFKGNYGPLYLTEKKKDTKTTPQKFYSPDRRKNDPSVKEEYDKVFGPYRFNGGYVNIVGEWDQVAEENEIAVVSVGTWTISASWEKPGPPPKKRKVRGNRGGGESFIGVELNTLGCFKF
jgi:hypothetical protein